MYKYILTVKTGKSTKRIYCATWDYTIREAGKQLSSKSTITIEKAK